MVADVVKEIEKEGTQKFIQAQKKEVFMELRSKLSDQKFIRLQPIFIFSDQILGVIHELK